MWIGGRSKMANAICSSVNRLFFMTCSPFHRVKIMPQFWISEMSGFLGQGHYLSTPVLKHSCFYSNNQPVLMNARQKLTKQNIKTVK
jgi:hypothetical protein